MASGTLAERLEPTEEQALYLAPQWKLIWWRFRRHRLALLGTSVVLLFYLVAMFAEFLALQDPFQRDINKLYMGMRIPHVFDGWKPHPWIYAVEQKRNFDTLAMYYVPVETKRYHVKYFVRGYEYKMLGLFRTNWHLFGSETPEGVIVALHPLGTDRMGRDLWSRMMLATRVSMSIGLVGVAISLFLGTILGGISGYYSGWVDVVVQRLIEFLRSIPTIPLWISLAAAIPRDWSVIKVYFAITVILSFIGWTTLAREVRGRFLSLREEDFVLAARLYGTGPIRTILRHMVPSFGSHIIAVTTLAVPAMIIAETALSFLGLGLRQPIISWGVLLFEAQNFRAVADAPWLLTPGAAVIIAVLAFNFMGDGLRDAADPYSV